jgi:UDP:flavonoid glycosyltransferase YjiC (YdhE family)
MPRRIAIATIGTRGDVQPFVALAVALRKRGHSVVIGSSSDFEQFITENGIEFHSLGTDIQAFIRQSQFDNAMSKSLVLYAPRLLRDGIGILKEACRQCWSMAQGADALIFQWDTTFAIDVAEALDIPAIMAALQPLNSTGEFPYCAVEGPQMEPLFNRLSLDPLVNRLTYVLQAAQQSYFDFPRDRMRAKLLGLRSRKRSGFTKNARGEHIVALHAYSQTLSPPPGDWPETTHVTGFWRLSDSSGWTPDAAFRRFLDAGDPPVYLGFGSMPWGAQRNTEIIVRALEMWGGRAVIGKGWGGIRAEDLPGTVHVVEGAPHDRLFELMKAVVHHGGAGTTHAGLYSGKPSFVVPQFFDQPYWGTRVSELGVGPPPVRLRKLTPRILAAALEDITTESSYRVRAEQLRDRLLHEDGTGYAADVIEDTIADYPGYQHMHHELMGAAS